MTGLGCSSLLVGLLAAAVVASPLPAGAGGDARLRADLEALTRRSVFFGHQSVGVNILDGVRDLAVQEGVPLRIVEVQGAVGVGAGTFAHAPMAANGDPLLKLRSFDGALASGPVVDVAFLKFCFVDVVETTDVRALFSRYQESIRALQARHPRTTFVHLTVPLTAVRSGLKAWVKRLIGRDRSREENARRDEFNALMRGAYQGKEPLFDLARIEATGADGQVETHAWGERRVPALVGAYTDDGGHLNEPGRRRVARELVGFLAALPVKAAPAR
jgi:hypothetical protein